MAAVESDVATEEEEEGEEEEEEPLRAATARLRAR